MTVSSSKHGSHLNLFSAVFWYVHVNIRIEYHVNGKPSANAIGISLNLNVD
jgi:hypothetical protein